MTHAISPGFLSRLFRCLPWALACVPGLAQAQFVDTFDTINPAWVTDRYAPAGFQSVAFLGDNRLQITIDQTGSSLNRAPIFSSSFFNTQGDQRPGGILGAWSLSANIYVSLAFDTTTGQLVRSSLWAHTGTTPGDGDYAIFGFTNASPTTPLNPAALDRSPHFQIFDGTDADPNSWFDAGLPGGFSFDAWHTLAASFTGATFDFSLDGIVIFSEATASGANLQTAFIEAYNFGQTDVNGLNSYSVYWDNATAAVIPEPAAFLWLTPLGALGIVLWRRRSSAKQ